MGEVVSCEIVDRVAHVTIERPGRRKRHQRRGVRVPGQRAEQIAGHATVGAVLPADDTQAAVHDLAARLAQGPGALGRLPRLVRDNLGADRDATLAAESAAQLAAMAAPDFAEAIAALRDGRLPVYGGR